MTDRHYLLRVIGLSAAPRIITLVLTMISFPLMVRALGPSKFGVVVFIGAVTIVVESFVDFGVSSAAGKAIAASREARELGVAGPHPSHVVMEWARLQTVIAVIGLVPLLVVTYFVASAGSRIKFSLSVLVLLVLIAWITIALNFVRASLTSLLAFRSLAALDGFESVFRSMSWLWVAYLAPTTLGLSIANFITAICASLLASALLVYHVRAGNRSIAFSEDAGPHTKHESLSLYHMLRESGDFLWLRLATRLFMSAPVMMFGRMFGAELVGIVGAFQKILDVAGFPFTVIGNALAVRAVGIASRGATAARSLWDVVTRLIAVSVVGAAVMYLAAGFLAALLTPGTKGSSSVLSALALTVITTAVSSVVAPMSDYVGALRSRNVLLSVCSVIEVAAIWAIGAWRGEWGAIWAYIVVLVLMNGGYIAIALRAFFPKARYTMPSEVGYAAVVTIVALGVTAFLRRALGSTQYARTYGVQFELVHIAIFLTIVMCAIAMYAPAKRFFLTRTFFDFLPRAGYQ